MNSTLSKVNYKLILIFVNNKKKKFPKALVDTRLKIDS